MLFFGFQLTLEPISFTKVVFIDPQLNWGSFLAYSAPKNKNPWETYPMDFCFYTRFADGIFGDSVQSFCVLYSLIQSIKFDETVTVISEKTILLTGI